MSEAEALYHIKTRQRGDGKFITSVQNKDGSAPEELDDFEEGIGNSEEESQGEFYRLNGMRMFEVAACLAQFSD